MMLFSVQRCSFFFLAAGLLTARELLGTQNASLVLNMCIIMERGSSTAIIVDYDKVAAAGDLALEYVTEKILPPGVTIKTYYRSAGSRCGSTRVAARAAIELYKQSIECDVFIGPGCVDAVADVCNIASYENIPVLAIPAGGITNAFAPRRTFPMMIRMSYRTTIVANCIQKLLEYLELTHSVVFIDQSVGFHQALGDIYFQELRKRPESFRNTQFRLLPTNSSDTLCIQHLKETQLNARTVVLLTGGDMTRRLMLLAHRLEMTRGDYLFVGVELFESSYWGLVTWRDQSGRDPMSEIHAREAFDSLLLLAIMQERTPVHASFSSLYVTRARNVYNYSFERDPPGSDPVNPTVTAFFDAVVLYANAVREVYNRGGPLKSNFSDILRAMKGVDYQSPLSGELSMNADGDRQLYYVFEDVLSSGQYEDGIIVDPSLNLTFQAEISWPGGMKPINMPMCGFRGDDPSCSKTTIVISVTAALLSAIALGCSVTGFLILRARNAKELNWWKIDAGEIDFVENLDVTKSADLKVDGSPQSQTDVFGISGARVTERAGTKLLAVPLSNGGFRPSSDFLREMRIIRSFHAPNLVQIVGMTVDFVTNLCTYTLEEYCMKGTLNGLIANEHFALDDAFKTSFMRDISEGMNYLHKSPLRSHGFLTSSACCLTNKFVVKVRDYGSSLLRNHEDYLPPKSSDRERNFVALLYRAPELLRTTMPPRGTKEGDVFSFAIIMQELICRSSPYSLASNDQFQAKLTVLKVKRGTVPACRPVVAKALFKPDLIEEMEKCWDEDPESRSNFHNLLGVLTKAFRKFGASIIDHLLKQMELHTAELEEQVQRKMDELKVEKARSDQLVKQMLPKAVGEALAKGGSVEPETFESVSVSFTEICGFSEMSSRAGSLEVVDLLNDLYCWFDDIFEKYNGYKVEAVGEIFLVASGLPERIGNRHAQELANLALHLRSDMLRLPIRSRYGVQLDIRAGIHSGPSVGGVVGLKLPKYCLFGDCVNTASRMESTSEVGRIQITGSTKALLDELGSYVIQERGQISVKGKGMMTTYYLVAKV